MKKSNYSEEEKREIINRVLYKRYIKEYLNIVNKYIIPEINQESLLSHEKTNIVLNHNRLNEISKRTSVIVPFSDKESLINLIKSFEHDYNIPYYMWIKNADICGLVELSSIWDFNFNFEFNETGDDNAFISLIRSDYTKEIGLDYYEESSEHYIEISLINRKVMNG